MATSLTDPSSMVIDLTQDSEPEDQKRINQPQGFFSSLAHRRVSSIPLKRKSDTSSEIPHENGIPYVNAFTAVNHNTNNNSNNSKKNDHNHLITAQKLNQQLENILPHTPSPAPYLSDESNPISVVIPSPSAQLRQEIDSAELISNLDITGLSEKYYPTDAHEKRATKGAYPSAKKVRRADVPFNIGQPGPFLSGKNRQPVSDQLCESLLRKLLSIKGPRVSVAPGDEKLLAGDTSGFEFINEYKLRKGVSHIDKEFMAGCNCTTICDPGRCSCLSVEENSNRLIIPYQRAQDNARLLVLAPHFMARTSMIFECNSLCGCNERCWNRVVQNGRIVRLEIFHTGNRGFGLRSPDRIRAGQFIDRYLGEVITRQAADTREEIASATNSHSYLFSLDFLVNDDDIYVVDGQNFGGSTRFINHSCNPNCRMFAVSRTHGDQRLYDLAFFALKEIPPMTELTFDYNPRWEKVKEVDPNAVSCLCGEENCRGQLWPNERKKTK